MNGKLFSTWFVAAIVASSCAAGGLAADAPSQPPAGSVGQRPATIANPYGDVLPPAFPESTAMARPPAADTAAASTVEPGALATPYDDPQPVAPGKASGTPAPVGKKLSAKGATTTPYDEPISPDFARTVAAQAGIDVEPEPAETPDPTETQPAASAVGEADDIPPASEVIETAAAVEPEPVEPAQPAVDPYAEPASAEVPPQENPQPAPDAAPAPLQTSSPGQTAGGELPFGIGGVDQWTSPEGLASTLKMLLLLTVVSLAPAVLLMTTCFVRIVVVLGLLRQALGTAQLPSGQVITSIALFMTLLIMWPVWSTVYTEAIEPYTAHEITLEEAWQAGVRPVRGFMSAQIERTGNSDDVWLFYKYLPKDTPAPSSYDDVPTVVLLPAFMLSELKTAFLIGFQIYLPFLVVDLVVASVTISMGMVMLPPVLVSLPLKLLLFVLVDGWHLVVGMLLESFQAFT